MARKHRFRFGFPDVFAGRPSVVQGRRSDRQFDLLRVAWMSAPLKTGSVKRGRRPIEKARDRFPGAGFKILATMGICT
jgi:hypothetical protein